MEKKKHNWLCWIGFMMAVPLQIILTVIAYIVRISPEAFPIWVTAELILIFVTLVISIIGVVISRKGVKKGKVLGIVGIVTSVVQMIILVSFCAMLLFIAAEI